MSTTGSPPATPSGRRLTLAVPATVVAACLLLPVAQTGRWSASASLTGNSLISPNRATTHTP